MSQQPGWHPDPGGAPGQYRYWNGERWSHETSATPEGVPAEFTASQGSKQPLILAAIAAVVVAAVAVWFFVGRGGDQADPEPTIEMTSTEQSPGQEGSPGEQPSDGGQPSATATETTTQLCASGNGNTIPRGDGKVNNSGLEIDVPAEWGFRLDKTQWTWLDDLWSYGDTKSGERAITVGRLPETMPAGDLAVKQQWLCLATYGMFKDAEVPEDLPGQVKPFESGGLKGHESTFSTQSNEGTVHLRIVVVETQGARVTVIGYHNDKAGDSAKRQIDQAFGTIRA